MCVYMCTLYIYTICIVYIYIILYNILTICKYIYIYYIYILLLYIYLFIHTIEYTVEIQDQWIQLNAKPQARDTTGWRRCAFS